MKYSMVRWGSDVRRARESFVQRGQVSDGLLRDPIGRSWERCAHVGLDPNGRVENDRLPHRVLGEVQDKNLSLLSHAKPLMENLYEQISNTRSMVILSDADGLILHSLGDADFVSKAQRVALQAGASWSEGDKGTNAIGTAVIERAPVLVHGAEHFFDRNTFLTCSASPILDPRGGLMGVLDISGDCRSFQNHTMALVRMSAQMIENRLLLAEYGNEVVLHFHLRPEFIGTLCEGIVAFSSSGSFIAANRSAMMQLNVPREALSGQTFSSLFDMPFEQMLDNAYHLAQVPTSMHMRSGIRIFATARAGSSVIPHRYAPAVPKTTPAAGALLPRTTAKKALTTLESLAMGDPRMQNAIDKARKVLGRDIPILIEGESGVGKELFASAFHTSGPRHDRPFVAVNCAAIPEGLIESELFGYQEGAFTGAKRKGCMGKIQQANGGTLFLDEIGDMPLQLQCRLLRVLQERTVMPLGSDKSYPVDISLICATHRKIRDEVAKGSFREDLYYRLNGLRFSLPPLRERTDIGDLVQALVRMESAADRAAQVSPEVMDLFRRYRWPGNIRQLNNVIRAALALLGEEGVIRRCHLPEEFLEEVDELDAGSGGESRAMAVSVPFDSTGNLEEIAANAIRKALADNGGNVSAAARQLGISRNTLYRKMGELKFDLLAELRAIKLKEAARRRG